MRRANGHGSSALAEPQGRESSEDWAMRTEFPFVLPRGYVDAGGGVHRRGVMRLATARDELVSQRDDRVRENPNYLAVVLISRVVMSIGEIHDIHGEVIENLFASDLAFLQDLYRRVNQDGHTHAKVICPSCDNEFAVDVSGFHGSGSDVSGSRLGES